MILQPIDKQSLLDSGILCCMIHILSVLLGANEGKVKQKTTLVESLPTSENSDGNELPVRRFEVAFFSCLSSIYCHILHNTGNYLLLFCSPVGRFTSMYVALL